MSRFDRDEAILKAKELGLNAVASADTLVHYLKQKYRRMRETNEDFEEHCGIALGVILTLFGGQFATTFAFVEAFHQSGYKDLMENGHLIQEQLSAAKKAVDLDAVVDADGDGRADIHQLSPRERVDRQFQVFLQNVDPQVVRKAMSALWICFLTASAAVRLKFAKVISMGTTLGEFLEKPAQKYLLPRLMARMDEKYHRWLPSLISYVTRAIGFSIALRLYRILATVATAIRGGDMLLQSINTLCVKRNMQFLTAGPADEILACSVVATGIYTQLFGPQSSIIVRLLLFPLGITEHILSLWVGTT